MEFNNPKVSVIIPTYNRPHLIGRAIKSVLDQTYQNFEIIVIDDSPNEETKKVIEGFNDKRIVHIHNQTQTSPHHAKNQGIKMASPESKYIAFLDDDDDEFLPHFLEKTIAELERDKELAAVTTLGESRLHSGEVISRGEPFPKEFWRCHIGNGWVVKKEIFFKENFWFDEMVRSEDLDLGIRVAKKYKVKVLPEILRVNYPYPAKKGESHSTRFIPGTPSGRIEYFYKKNLKIYKEAGKRAEGWLHYFIGMEYCRAGDFQKARSYFRKGLLIYPNLKYFLYYLLTFIYPKIFLNLNLLILKHKILRKWLQTK